MAKFVVEQLQKSPDDHLTFTIRPIANGVKYRLEMESGLLRLLGRLAIAQTQFTAN